MVMNENPQLTPKQKDELKRQQDVAVTVAHINLFIGIVCFSASFGLILQSWRWGFVLFFGFYGWYYASIGLYGRVR